VEAAELSDAEAAELSDAVDALDSVALDDDAPPEPDPPQAASPKQPAHSRAITIKAKRFLMMHPFPAVPIHGAARPVVCAPQTT